MRTQEIWPDTIDKAAEDILSVLKEKPNSTRSVGSRDNVFYFDGWDGLGASAVLRAIAQRLTATSPAGKRALSELGFEQVIHIDCSIWESRRALQRAVAEQLELPNEVMELFDRQDEEEDLRGVAHGSRTEVEEVVKEMHRHIQKMDRRFLVIFHNGSNAEIDLATFCGFPLSGFSTSKVLWTFQGRFRLKPRTKVDRVMASAGMTDVFISATSTQWEEDPAQLWPFLVHQEATEVATSCKISTGPRGTIDQPTTQVSECFLYMLELCRRAHHSIDYDFSTHGANYWVCDGIIHHLQQGERHTGFDVDKSWRAAEALQGEMQLDVDYHQFLPSSPLARFVESTPYWTSPTCGLTRIPSGTILNGNMFQNYSNKLRVLKLSRCTFNFLSPPFLCCYSLRFLWLDHCQGTTGSSTDGEGKEEDLRRCFQRLWVFDVRYTDCDQILSAQILDLMSQLRELNVMGVQNWDMGQLQGRLSSIRKLRVTKSTVTCSCSENDLFSGMNRMELLDFSRNNVIFPMMGLSGPGAISNSIFLETVIIADQYWLEQISFRGCTKLKNLLLQGWMEFHTLDISGTSVKTLDLTATTIFYLDELYLLGCENLCAVTWPPKDKMKQGYLSKLRIDTTQPAPTAQSCEEKAKRGTTAATGTLEAAAALHGSRPISEFPWYISVQDARLLRSLEAVYSDSRMIYVEVSSPTSPTVAAGGGSKDEGIKSSGSSQQKVPVNLQRQMAPAVYAADRTMDRLHQVSEGDDDSTRIMCVWPCPDAPDLPEKSCYMHIQDQTGTKLPRSAEDTSTITVPEFVSDCAKILHVHAKNILGVTAPEGMLYIQTDVLPRSFISRLDIFAPGLLP